ncbi:hypothetical protein ACROYT_G029333 [Oculina patagonica]
MAVAAGGKKKSKGSLDHEQIVLQFNQMRQEYRSIMGKIGELEMEVNEHGIVIEALKGVEPERRCFRMIGGVLVERTVKDVLPALENNKDQISGLISKLNETLTAKEQELTAFKDKHNIHVKGEKESPTEDAIPAADKTSGVLVAQDSSS